MPHVTEGVGGAVDVLGDRVGCEQGRTDGNSAIASWAPQDQVHDPPDQVPPDHCPWFHAPPDHGTADGVGGV